MLYYYLYMGLLTMSLVLWVIIALRDAGNDSDTES